LTTQRRAGLERQKAYYDFFAAMSATERDRRFRERFDEIDTNHDGIIDHNERVAWHDKQRAFYDRSNSYRRETAANELHR
jgi:Ca2+-binding EF-hand superfamily protein